MTSTNAEAFWSETGKTLAELAVLASDAARGA
jgi:hypothetical protein